MTDPFRVPPHGDSRAEPFKLLCCGFAPASSNLSEAQQGVEILSEFVINVWMIGGCVVELALAFMVMADLTPETVMVITTPVQPGKPVYAPDGQPIYGQPQPAYG